MSEQQGPGGNGPPPPPGGWPQHPPQQQMQHYYHPPPAPVAVYVTQQNVMTKPAFKHGLHLVLDLISCGLWIPVHLICWALH